MEADRDRGAIALIEREIHSLTLAEISKNRILERPGSEVYLRSVIIAHDDASSCCGIVQFDDALHGGGYAFSILPALMHDVHTRAWRVLVPCLTRTFWMFGTQRRLDRLWEKVTFFPKLGSLLQTSQRYDMR